MAGMTTLRGVAQAPRNTQAVGNIDIQNIPDSAFIPVKRHRNIVTAFIANKQQDGSRRQADIAIVTPLGDKGYITRQELISKYVYVQNRAINLHAWKSGKKYIVYQRDSSTMYAMQVPTNLTASVNGKMANVFKKDSGDYIVCYCGADGKVDKRTAAVISSKMFHKMFSIPMNETIRKHRGSGNKFFTPQRKYLTAPPAAQQNRQNQRVNGLTLQSTAGQSASNQGQQQQRLNPMRPSYDMNAATLPGVSRDVARPLTAQTVNPYKTVGRIMNGSKRVGFIILVNGKPQQVTDNQMLKMVASGKITDVMVQQTSNGYNYFRGNGIVIDNLPSKQVGQGMNGNGNRGQNGFGQQPGQSGFGAGGFGSGQQSGGFGAGGFGSQAGQNSFGAGGFGSARQNNNNGGFGSNF